MRFETRDRYILELIQRHGPLSSLYLWEFTKSLRKDRTGFRKRLLALKRTGYLDRPTALNHPLVWADYKVYKLTEKGRQVLGETRDRYAQPIPGWDEHAYMTATITANIELQAVKQGHRFISQEEMLRRAPEETRNDKSPLSIPCKIQKKLSDGTMARSARPKLPDQIFGIDYGTGARHFALEADRGHEPETRNNLNQNSIERHILCYDNILHDNQYEKRFGIGLLRPLFITTSLDRVHNGMELAKKVCPKHAHLFLFGSIPGFHEYIKTPPLFPELFGELHTTRGMFDISKP